mgnify:CR=1 FL=1
MLRYFNFNSEFRSMNVKKLLKLNLKRRNKHKVMAVGYALSIAFAFVLSITNNNNVSASVSKKDTFDYMLLENSIQNGINDPETIYPESSIENIKSLYEIVNYGSREKTVEQEIEVSSGDTFLSILSDLGMDYDEAHDIFVKLKKVYDPTSLKIGQKIAITTTIDSKENKLLSLDNITIMPSLGQRYIVEKTADTGYTVRSEKDELLEEVNSARGEISGTLAASMQKKGVPHRVIANFINIFSYSVDFRRDVRKGDSFEIIYENQITPDGQTVKSGNILYASLTLRKDKIALYRFKDKAGNVDYYNEKGLAMKKTLDRKPLSFRQARISSPFGRRRHPILKDIRVHWGVDYAAPKGTKVFAGGDGVIQMARYNGGYGNFIKIRHNSEYSTAYGHMWKFAKGIRPGVRVKRGQVIGYVGSTGRSTGPHLHYEVIRNGKRVNPRTIKAAAGENLKGKNLDAFRRQVAMLRETHKNMFAAADNAKLASAEK